MSELFNEAFDKVFTKEKVNDIPEVKWAYSGEEDFVTYQSGIPARKRSPIPVLTGLNVEQLRSYDERRYLSVKPCGLRTCSI